MLVSQYKLQTSHTPHSIYSHIFELIHLQVNSSYSTVYILFKYFERSLFRIQFKKKKTLIPNKFFPWIQQGVDLSLDLLKNLKYLKQQYYLKHKSALSELLNLNYNERTHSSLGINSWSLDCLYHINR